MTGKLILISGRKGTGKTYVTEYLEGMLAGKVEIYPMATMLKRIVATVTNCSVSQLDSHYFKLSKSPYIVNRYGIDEQLTYRKCLLHFGKLLRFDNDRVFIDDVINRIRITPCDYFIIPDIREQFELNCIKDFARQNEIELTTIRVLRNTKMDDASGDKTECDLENYTGWDFHLDNTVDGYDSIHKQLTYICKEKGYNVKKGYVEQKLF